MTFRDRITFFARRSFVESSSHCSGRGFEDRSGELGTMNRESFVLSEASSSMVGDGIFDRSVLIGAPLVA